MPTDPQPCTPKVALPRFPASHSASMPPTSESNASSAPPKSPRKSPHCKTCGRPRKGHVLRSCGDDTQPITPTARSTAKRATRAAAVSTPSSASSSPRTPLSDAPGKPKVAVRTPTAAGTPLAVRKEELLAMEERDRRDKSNRRRDSRANAISATLSSLPSISTVTGELLDQLVAVKILDEEEPESLALGDLPVVDEAGKLDQLLRWRAGSLADDSDAGIHASHVLQPLCNDAVPDISSKTPTRKSAPLASEETPTRRRTMKTGRTAVQ
ncbi:unnamed protein product [Mycena citricolor]|uniref:Uncharacterized protein n=1 Tax=Mycena citricolor TaxID=2018698 RepID=A0AAD2HEA7_9AGAR|nr:unnamed protein product [Mycena citricolor]